VLARVVGIGDSLTAGTQSNGTMGVSYFGNPVSALPGGLVPATQTNGFFALLQEQIAGGTVASAVATISTPATSVLPLIASPGNGGQIVVSATAPGFGPTQLSCNAFNQSMYSLSAIASYRANPTTLPLDVGVPGITAHEAIYMVAPHSGPPPGPVGSSCPGFVTLAGDPTSGGLQTLLDAEDSNFYPILGSFAGKLGPNQPLTMLNAALADRPTLSTVWLGANDLLKFTFSGGQAPIDTPAQMQADIAQIINSLKGVGSKVVVANLPDILALPQFTKGGATLTATMSAFLQKVGIPAPFAALIASNASANIQTKYGVTGNGYLTESGFLAAFSQCIAQFKGGAGTVNCNPVLDPTTAGSGFGAAYLPDAFAAQVQGLNTAYNAAIAAAATSTGAPLVDIHQTFVNIATAGGVPINPPKCCSLAFGGGLLSFDGLHPSNTGYAILSNVFIATINASYGTAIPAVNASNVYNGAGGYTFPDPYAMH
ncbi:MAG: SGNH/GDSL hydrolase family protein, partial [Candidatus Eremiobacteraeota bacterium]|nr:SGNH/GDSL hydrolase family protein [Candidatus Eremiobacteraeota bacterium]